MNVYLSSIHSQLNRPDRTYLVLQLQAYAVQHVQQKGVLLGSRLEFNGKLGTLTCKSRAEFSDAKYGAVFTIDPACTV